MQEGRIEGLQNTKCEMHKIFTHPTFENFEILYTHTLTCPPQGMILVSGRHVIVSSMRRRRRRHLGGVVNAFDCFSSVSINDVIVGIHTRKGWHFVGFIVMQDLNRQAIKSPRLLSVVGKRH